MRQYRIVEINQGTFEVQKKGWFRWHCFFWDSSWWDSRIKRRYHSHKAAEEALSKYEEKYNERYPRVSSTHVAQFGKLFETTYDQK